MGEHTIIIKIQDYSFQKKVVISDGQLARVSPSVVLQILWKLSLILEKSPSKKIL